MSNTIDVFVEIFEKNIKTFWLKKTSSLEVCLWMSILQKPLL